MNTQKLKGHVPDFVLNQLPDAVNKFQINTPLRMAHFLAQCSHESGGFKSFEESLNYSAQGLRGTFGKYFPEKLEESYAKNPERIANRVYANRMGNGDEASGDGYKYRGRGAIQLTGKDNYKAFSTAINENCVANPDLVSKKYPIISAAWFFHKNGINKIADGGPTDATITSVTKKVNGGTIGLNDRIKHFKHYYSLLT